MRNCLIRLTDDLVPASHPASREYSLRDTKISGLSLRVLPSGIKSWVMRFQDGGRARRVTLGDARHMPIEDARSRAHALLAGNCPKPAMTKPKGMTFKAFAVLYRKRRTARWKPSTRRTNECYLESTLLPFFRRDVHRWHFRG